MDDLLALGYVEEYGDGEPPSSMIRPWGSLAPIPRIAPLPLRSQGRSNSLGLAGLAIAAAGLFAYLWTKRRAS